MTPWIKKAYWNKIMRFLDRSVTFRHNIWDRSVTFRHGIWDQSVTFRHNNIKGKESWSNLLYLTSKNLYFKWVWCGGMSPHSLAWYCDWWCTCYGVVVNGLCDCCLLPVKYCSWFYIIIQCILVSILSWPMIPTQYVFLVLTPTCIFFFVLLWSATSVPSTSTRPQL